MRVTTLVTLGALLAVASTSAAAQRPEPPEPRAPRPPRAPSAPPAPSIPRPAPEVFAFGFGDARPDRATLGVLLGEAGPDGIRVADVAEDGPAARAGIRAGDRIVAVGDVSLRLDERDAEDALLRMTAERRLRLALERADAGDEVTLRVASGGDERTVRVRTVRADALREPTTGATTIVPAAPRPAPRARALPSPRADRASVGLTLGTTGSVRDTLGVFVAAVAPDGPAERAGIHEGMRIAAINGVDLRADRDDVDDRRLGRERAARLERELERLEPGDEVTLRVWDAGRIRDVRVRSARASEVYRDGAAAWAPGGTLRLAPGPTIHGMPGAEAMMRRLEALERGGGELRRRVAPEVRVEGVAPRVLRIAPSPDVRVEIEGWDDLPPAERERVERRLEAVRERLETSRERLETSRERRGLVRESRAAAATTRARALELRSRARAAAPSRAMPAVAWPRRWMD